MAQPPAASATNPVHQDAPAAASITGEAVVLDVQPASVILRGAGAAIDALFFCLILFGLVQLALWLGVGEVDPAMGRALLIIGIVFGLVILPMVVETASRGRSLGKLAIGARIVRDDGGAIQMRHSFVRAAVGLFEIYATFGAVAVMCGLLNDRSKRLGDLLAGTHSQLERVPKYTPPTRPVPAELATWSTVADVAAMPDRLSRRVAQFLSQADRMLPASRERAATTLAHEVAAYVSPVPAVPAETFLVAVAAVRRNREYAALMIERGHLDALAPVLSGNPHGFPDR